MKRLIILMLLCSGCVTYPIETVKICPILKIHFCNEAYMNQNFRGMLGCTDAFGEIWVLKEDWNKPPTRLECEILGEEVYHQWLLKGDWHTKEMMRK